LGWRAYSFINDETLRLANHGYAPIEIAERVKLPEVLDRHWALRGYYGTINHNATWSSWAAPMRYSPRRRTPTSAANIAGSPRSSTTSCSPSQTTRQRGLQAAALEQLGYQSEAGTWRNLFLTGAQELRHGTPNVPMPSTASPDSIRAMSLDLFFSYLGVRLNGEKAAGKQITLNFVFTDTSEKVVQDRSRHQAARRVARTA
jgi:alkyl sulfatase BDS1-like metallo-beta-lactamase superfamily hydrolase